MKDEAPIGDGGIEASADNPTILIPGTGGKYEHIELPLDAKPPSADLKEAYQLMVERPGFPAASTQEAPDESKKLDIEL